MKQPIINFIHPKIVMISFIQAIISDARDMRVRMK